MKEITPKESLEFYLNTLKYLDVELLNNSDEELKRIVLEELDADSHTFLHQFTIDRLIENNLIPKNVGKKSIELRDKIRNLIDTKFSVNEIRNDEDWIEVRNMAKNILAEITKINIE